MTTVGASEVTVGFSEMTRVGAVVKVTVTPHVSPRDPWLPPWFLGWVGCESQALARSLWVISLPALPPRTN